MSSIKDMIKKAASSGSPKDIRRLGVKLGDHLDHVYALEVAVSNNRLLVVRYLLSRYDYTKDELSAAIRCTRTDDRRVMMILHSVGADIHAQDEYLLRTASHAGDAVRVRSLVALGADISALNYDAIRLACASAQPTLVEYLCSSTDVPACIRQQLLDTACVCDDAVTIPTKEWRAVLGL